MLQDPIYTDVSNQIEIKQNGVGNTAESQSVPGTLTIRQNNTAGETGNTAIAVFTDPNTSEKYEHPSSAIAHRLDVEINQNGAGNNASVAIPANTDTSFGHSYNITQNSNGTFGNNVVDILSPLPGVNDPIGFDASIESTPNGVAVFTTEVTMPNYAAAGTFPNTVDIISDQSGFDNRLKLNVVGMSPENAVNSELRISSFQSGSGNKTNVTLIEGGKSSVISDVNGVNNQVYLTNWGTSYFADVVIQGDDNRVSSISKYDGVATSVGNLTGDSWNTEQGADNSTSINVFGNNNLVDSKQYGYSDGGHVTEVNLQGNNNHTVIVQDTNNTGTLGSTGSINITGDNNLFNVITTIPLSGTYSLEGNGGQVNMSISEY